MSNNYAREIDSVFSIDAINFMRKSIVDAYGNEVYFGINFNAYGILDYIEVMARGNKDSVPAIISLSLEFDAVIHNHPSGDTMPSKSDIEFTKRIIQASKILELQFLDHIIIGNYNYISIFAKIEELGRNV